MGFFNNCDDLKTKLNSKNKEIEDLQQDLHNAQAEIMELKEKIAQDSSDDKMNKLIRSLTLSLSKSCEIDLKDIQSNLANNLGDLENIEHEKPYSHGNIP